jgi:Na+-driven multidrug efflux pump
MLRMSSGVGAPRASARGGFAARASTSAAASARTPRRRSHETGPFRAPLAVAPARLAPTATTRRRGVRVAVINNDRPASDRSADESLADESFDQTRLPRDARPSLGWTDASDDFIGVDEFGVGIRGDAKFRRRSEARDAYWREQARELEQALAASGDSETKVLISEKGRLFLRSDDGDGNANDSAVGSLPTGTMDDARTEEDTKENAPPTWTWRERFALLAQISALGLPALVNSCVEPLLSSAETACAAKIGTVYLAALAPSSSLFAFAAEMCFAMSVVVTTAVAKAAAKAAKAREALRTAAGETSGDADEETLAADAAAAAATTRRTATAATTTSFFVGAVLAVGLAALADPLLRMMHVPPETAPIVRAYVATRALGLPFFAASNAAEGVYIGHGDGVAPMAAWTCTGAGTMAALLLFAHPHALNWGLPGAAAAIAMGQIATAAWFARGMRKRGWLASSKDVGSVNNVSASRPGMFHTALLGCRDALDVLKRTKMANEIGWMFLGAVSRMGTYAILTASASALGVVPGATHKVALEIFWLLSFLTEPIFTACNALLPRELAQGKIHAARRLRNALVVTAVAVGCLLACAGGFLANMGVFSDDPAVAAALKSLAAPLAASLGLAATAYGVEGTIIGCGQVGYLGRTHCRDFFVVAFLLWAREAAFPGGGGLAGTWWLLAGFQGLRICQHWFHLWLNKPLLTYSAEAEEAEHEVVPRVAEQAAEPEGGRGGLALA